MDRITFENNAHFLQEVRRGASPEALEDNGHHLVAEDIVESGLAHRAIESARDVSKTHASPRMRTSQDKAQADRYSSPDGIRFKKV
jgi:hypothetical protein